MGRIFHMVCLLVLGCLVQPGSAMAAPEGPRVAVLELQGTKLNREMVALLSDKVREGVLTSTRGKNVTIMSRENMAIIAKDMGLDLSCVEGECEVETARNIGAAYVVSGVVVDVGGGLWICTIKIHRTDSGALLATGDVRGRQPADLIDKISPRVQELMTDAFGGGGSQSTVQLGGDDVDFAGQAAAAGQAGAGGVADVGEATLELGSGSGDIAALVAQAQAKKAERERLAAEEAQLQAQLKAAQARELEKAKAELLSRAKSDHAALAQLMQGAMSDETVGLLEQYVKRYAGATVTVSGQRTPVTVPEVARVEQALDKERLRRARELKVARRAKIRAAREKILAEGARDYATLKPLLGEPASAETRPALQAFVSKYGDARVRVDTVTENVSVPGVSEVRRTLGLKPRKRPEPAKAADCGTDKDCLLADARNMLRAAMAVKIDGPKSKVNAKKEGEVLKAQFVAKANAVRDAEARYVQVIKTGSAEHGVAALVDLGKLYENLAESLRTSYVPPSLNETQREYYAANIEDKAYPSEEKAVAAYSQVLSKSYELNLYDDNTLYALHRLGELRPADYPRMWEDLPPSSAKPDAARNAYMQAPGDAAVAVDMAVVALRYADLQVARQVLKIHRDGGDPETLTALHLICLRMEKKYAEAAKLYKKVVKDHPGSQLLHFNAASFHEKYTHDYKQARVYLKLFHKSHGHISPEHELFVRRERIYATQAAEEAKKQAASRKKKEALHRKQRATSSFELLKAEAQRLEMMLKDYGTCTTMVESGGTVQGEMVLEQSLMVIQMEEVEDAADMMMFYEQLMPQLEQLIKLCPEPN